MHYLILFYQTKVIDSPKTLFNNLGLVKYSIWWMKLSSLFRAIFDLLNKITLLILLWMYALYVKKKTKIENVSKGQNCSNSAQISFTQIDSAWLSSTQLNSAQLSLTQLNSAQLSSTQLDSARLSLNHENNVLQSESKIRIKI